MIREMQQRTSTRIQIPNQPAPGQIFRLATVTGPAEGCQKIQEIIARISNEQSSQFVMTGECFNQYGQQAYGQQQSYGGAQGQQQYGAASAASGQQDYSAQWAAYYAAQASAQGGSSGAAAQQQAGSATNGATAASSGATGGAASGAADQYYEDFFRYSYHYGEEAARKAYGAWSPPAGTPNPYGTNPNPSAAPANAPSPAGAPASSSASAAASIDPKKHKDSSVRSVSNLPAWMTKS